MADNKVGFESTVTLPSRGLIYTDKKIPAEISIRGMTVREEKVLYASTGGTVFNKVLKSCVTSPEDLDVTGLIAADEMFLIIQLRIATFGPEYKVQVTCPHCGRSEVYTINLGDFEVDYLPEDFKEPFEVTLPRSGDVLSLKLLRNADNEMVEKLAKKHSKQFNQSYRELEYECRMAKYIQAVNGKPIDYVDARDYFNNMASMDSMKMQTAINDIHVGVDTTASVVCTSCKEEFEFSTPITSEFFRPTIK